MSDGSLNWMARAGIAMASRVNPLTGGPAAPLKADALLDSFGPSLMPRKSLHQGLAGGLALFSADLIGRGVDHLARKVATPASPLVWRLGVRAAMGAGGAAIAGISESDEEPTSRAALRSAGRLTAVAAAGGIIYEIGRDLEGKVDWPLLPVATGLGGFALVASRMAKELETRQGVILRWTDDDKPASLPGSLSIAMAIGTLGNVLVDGFMTSRRSLGDYLGGDAGQMMVGRALNIAFWASGAAALYGFLVQRLSRLNGEVEVNFATPPSNEYVSGGPNSISPFEELGLQGRRFVTEVVPASQIDATLGEAGALHPIRVLSGSSRSPSTPQGDRSLPSRRWTGLAPSIESTCCWFPLPAQDGSTTP